MSPNTRQPCPPSKQSGRVRVGGILGSWQMRRRDGSDTIPPRRKVFFGGGFGARSLAAITSADRRRLAPTSLISPAWSSGSLSRSTVASTHSVKGAMRGGANGLRHKDSGWCASGTSRSSRISTVFWRPSPPRLAVPTDPPPQPSPARGEGVKRDSAPPARPSPTRGEGAVEGTRAPVCPLPPCGGGSGWGGRWWSVRWRGQHRAAPG